ncbi:MAG: response regulator [Acidaminococcales bacterium]|nr:response regulator [Acidaminococcales bacterium]
MKRILVIDDNLASLKQISSYISPYYDVLLAKSGALGLRICEKEMPDLILLDVEMPEMNGFETMARLKKIPELCGIPVVFLTGNNSAATEIMALESGAMDFVPKAALKDILLHRIELHLRLSSYQLSMENTIKEIETTIVTSFSELIEFKDTNAGSHVMQTSRCAKALGRQLMRSGQFRGELDEHYLDVMARATPFHDIGKIGVSDLILLKPAALTPEEYDKVKLHTTIGANVLENTCRNAPSLSYMQMAKTIAGGHHERYDGTGYPCGMVGEAIPLCCRIVSVANVYCSLLSDRVFRKAMSHEKAGELIAAGAGGEFDPRVVRAFLAARDEIDDLLQDK